MTKLGDVMVRDPFYKPVEFKFEKGTDLEQAFCRLVPPEKRKYGVLITSRADEPKSVIDAKADGTCEVCLSPVWLAPSSKRVTYEVNVVCMRCLEQAHEARVSPA